MTYIIPDIIKKQHAAKLHDTHKTVCDLVKHLDIKSIQEFIDTLVIPGFYPMESVAYFTSKG